ncbi:MAG: RHS repeat-associated core domain-containing protein [Acidobacteriota bacterium]
MHVLRQTLRKHRVFVLAFLLVETFHAVGGLQVIEAREQERQAAEQDLIATAQLFGVADEDLDLGTETWLEEVSQDLWRHGEKLPRVTGAWALALLSTIGASEGEETPRATADDESAVERAVRPRSRLRRSAAPPRAVPALGAAEAESTRAPSLIDESRVAEAVTLAERRLPTLDDRLPVRRAAQEVRTITTGAAPAAVERSSAIAPPSRPLVRSGGTPAPEIDAFAADLDDSPSQIFAFVHDNIDFDPKWGADSPPLGTLWERRGTSWDQAWLLQDLLIAAGIDARLEWGEIEIEPALLLEITGVDDAFRAGDLLTTAGLPIVLVVDGSQVISARMPHAWVKAHLDYVPDRGVEAGTPDTWIRLDPSLKTFDRVDGQRTDADVSFVLGDYLESGTTVSPRAEYEAALLAFMSTVGLSTLDEVKPLRSIRAESFPYIPGTLRAKILSSDEAATVPADYQVRLDLEIDEADGTELTSWSTPVSSIYGGVLELRWPGATAADQSTLDLNGGVFATPPYEVDLRPSLLLSGVEIAAGTAIGSAEDVDVIARLTPPAGLGAGDGTSTVAVWELFAGEHGVMSFDFGHMPQEIVDGHLQDAAAATEPEDIEAASLAAAAATFLRAQADDLAHLAALRWHRPVNIGAAVMAVQRGAVSLTSGGFPDTFSQGPLSIAIGARPIGLFPIDGLVVSSIPNLELLGAQSSFREGEALASVFGGDHVTAVGFLTLAVREGQTLTLVDAANVDAVLAAATLSDEAEAAVRFATSQGAVAWVAETMIELGGFRTTGYVIEDPTTGAGGYFVTYQRRITPLDGAVIFHAPLDLDIVTAPTPVRATIDVEGIEQWTLATSPVGEAASAVIATGGGPVTDRYLADFDPTLMLNGMHDLVLTGRDNNGRAVSGKVTLVVDGNMKIGNLALSFVDVAIPISGLSIELIRTYDSRQRLIEGDFGFGWDLTISNGQYRNNRLPGDGWAVQAGLLPCDTALETKTHLTTVRLSDREIYLFRPRLTQLAPTIGGCFAVVDFDYFDGPTPGASLEVIGAANVFWANGSNQLLYADGTDLFEPQAVRLRTRDGRTFDVDLTQGVTRLEDPNGNSMTLSPESIEHSNGIAVTIVRDAQNRVEKIIDPLNYSVDYQYDANGDLEIVSDQVDDTTRFAYAEGHYLDKIFNNEGEEVGSLTYQNGRLSKACHDGVCSTLEHDLEGRGEVMIDSTGVVSRFEYDNYGNVVTAEDGLGNQSLYEYDGKGRLTKFTDPLGRVTRLVINADGEMTARITPHAAGANEADYTTTYGYDSAGRLTSIELPTGVITELVRDTAGNLLEVREAGTVIESWTYNSSGFTTSATSADGTFDYQDFNAFGDPRRVIDPAGIIIDLTYDDLGRVETLDDGGIAATYTHDGLGRTKRIDFEDDTWIEYDFDHLDDWEVQRPSSGATVTRVTDLAGRVTGYQRADGSGPTYEYDTAGRVKTIEDGLGRAISMEYDVAGRRKSVTRDGSGRVDLTLDEAGDVIASSGPLGTGFSATYGDDGKLASVTTSRNHTWSFTHGLRESVTTNPLGDKRYVRYSDIGLPIETEFEDGTFVQQEFLEGAPFGEERDFPTRFVDERNKERLHGYEPGTALLRTTTALGGTVPFRFDYGDNGLTDIEFPSGQPCIGYVLDSESGLPTEVTYGGVDPYDLTYEPSGDLSRMDRPAGEWVDWDHDPYGNLIGRTTSSGLAETYVWDDAFQLTSSSNASSTVTYGYAGDGGLETLSRDDGSIVEYERDEAGRTKLVRLTSVNQQTYETSYEYDSEGNVTAITDPSGGRMDMTYDSMNRLELREYPNGIEQEFTYDLRSRVEELEYRDPNGVVFLSFVYQRGDAGEPTRITNHDGSYREIDYDDSLQIEEERWFDTTGTLVETVSYGYDDDGNRTSRTTAAGTEAYAYPTKTQLSSRSGPGGVVNYTYDANGRREALGTDWDLEWDELDRLTRASRPDGTAAFDYSFDPDDRRIGVTTANGSRRLLSAPTPDGGLDSFHLITDDAGVLLTGFAFHGALPLVEYDSGATRYLLHDETGSVIGWTDDQGILVGSAEYDAFGRERTGAALSTDVGGYAFHGQWRDAGTDLYYLRARQYEPETGLFLSRDPVQPDVFRPETCHPYVFAFSNPKMFADPTGEVSVLGVSISNAISNTLNGIRVGGLNQVRRKLIREVREFTTDLLINALHNTIGMFVPKLPFQHLAGEGREWREFERAFQDDVLCRVLPQSVIYFEPVIRQTDGQPLGDGRRCDGSRDPADSSVRNKAGHREPDFVLSPVAPKTASRRGLRKAFLIGEIKIGLKTFYNMMRGRRKGQWAAIYKFAQRYQFYPGVLVLVSFRPDDDAHWKYVRKRIVRDHMSKGRVGFLFVVGQAVGKYGKKRRR